MPEAIQPFNIVNNPAGLDLESVSGLLEMVGMSRRPREKMARAIEGSTEVVAAYNEAGMLVGFGRLISDNAFYGTLWDIAVHPEYQQLGIGKRIVGSLLARCRILQLRMVGLFTALDNREFYNSFGFEMLDDIHPMTLDLTQFRHK